MKKDQIIYWVTTGLLFLSEGVMPALTGHTKMSIDGFLHLGYPEYFVTILVVFKVLGALALIIPMVPARIKEWAYAGLAFNFICAFISYWIVDGLNGLTLIPLIFLAVLVVSYVYYHKINSTTGSSSKF
jgi:DoxX-like family